MNFDLLIDLHKQHTRQGPGSHASTLKALSFIATPQIPMNILDIGCGTGSSVFTLAASLEGKITALDMFPEFLEVLQNRMEAKKLKSTISTLVGNMEDLPFEKESLDLIWAEGAIYNMGFKEGLKYWKSFLKPKGYMGISEITWTTNQRPKELEDFWCKEYPQIATASEKINQITNEGLQLKGYFELPQKDWWETYYLPLEAGFPDFLKRHSNSAEALEVVRMHEEEIQFYKQYQDYYSYGFYVMQKEG